MTRTATTSTWRSATAWLVAAIALWLAAAAVDRRTTVIVDNLGDHLRFDVAGTELVLPSAIRRVDGLTLWMADSIDPPEVIDWTVTRAGETTRIDAREGPHRSPGAPAPVGDWWVDDRCTPRVVHQSAVDLDGAFRIGLVVRGRSSGETSLSLAGDPTIHLSFRRGLKDNYAVIRDAGDAVLAATTLAPTPAADLRALLAQLGRGASAGCLVIGSLFVALVLVDRRRATAPPRGATAAFSRFSIPAALALTAVAVAGSAWVALSVLEGIPHQIDEVVYLLQARWFLDGELAPRITAIQDHLRVPLTHIVDGRWVGHYPFGWPMLLSAGLAVARPELVNPLLSGLLVVLVFLIGREIDDDTTGLAAAAVTAVSPLVRVIGGSFFPHTLAAVLVATALLCAFRARSRPHWTLGAGVGLALGACLAVRPLTAVAVAAALGGWMLVDSVTSRRTGDLGSILGPAIGAGLVASIPVLVANHHLTGHPLTFPYSLVDGRMYAAQLVPFGLRNLDALLATASASFAGWGWPTVVGGLALALPLGFAAVPFLLRRATATDAALLAVVVVFALGHLPTRAHGLHGYGARYLVDIAPCLVLLAARGFRELARRAGPTPVVPAVVAGVFVLLNLWTLSTLPARLEPFSGYYGISGELERQLTASGVDRAVVLLPGDGWLPWAEAARLMTGPRRHAIVFAADLGDNSVITGAYPDLPVLRWDGEHLIPDDRGVH